MCSIFSVCSKRFSVIMMSMNSCSWLLALFGASSSTGEVPSVEGALKWYYSASVNVVCERTIRPETDHLSSVMGLTASRGLRPSASRDKMVVGLPSVSLDTSKRRLPAVEHGAPASASH